MSECCYFNNSFNKLLIFKNRSVEELYQNRKHIQATKLYPKCLALILLILSLQITITLISNSKRIELILEAIMMLIGIIDYTLTKCGIQKCRALLCFSMGYITLIIWVMIFQNRST